MEHTQLLWLTAAGLRIPDHGHHSTVFPAYSRHSFLLCMAHLVVWLTAASLGWGALCQLLSSMCTALSGVPLCALIGMSYCFDWLTWRSELDFPLGRNTVMPCWIPSTPGGASQWVCTAVALTLDWCVGGRGCVCLLYSPSSRAVTGDALLWPCRLTRALTTATQV